MEPSRGEALRGSRGEGRVTAGSSQEGLEQCAGERRAAPQEGREGEMVSPSDRWNQVKMNRSTARKGTRRLGERWTG